LIGITVIDYLAKYILADYQSVSDVSVGNNFLLNTNGYWLYNDIDPLKSWSFTNPNKLNVNFPNEYPEVWKQIKSNKSGEIQTKSYCFIYQDMTPVNQQLVYSDVQSDNDSEWIALTMIPTKNDPFLIYRTEPISFMLHVSQTYLLVYGYIILLGFAIAFLLLIYLNDNKKIKYISERDIMTNAYNRHTGLAFLEKTYLDSTKNKKTIAISYIDINGLKEVNDNLGHNIGDELILTVAEVIKSSIRENDFMIRYGGDEFILVFTDVDNEITQRIWLRINNQLAQINESENRRYLISISYGIRITKLEEFENIDDIVKEADAQMYKHKRDTKSSLIIIR
ncbi:MAG: GGDEF domain-containing protein, partial [Erysipelotrichaceae bacterium]